MSEKKYLAYRGQLQALYGLAQQVLFVSTHIEKDQSTALYRLDMDTLTLRADPLPFGATAITSNGNQIWLAGSDHILYQSTLKTRKIKALAVATQGQALRQLALLSAQRLAILQPHALLIVDTKTAKLCQRIDLTEEATVMAVDPQGQWLAIGANQGQVTVFDGEQQEVCLSHSARLHNGCVTALLFEPTALRFYSAGKDQQLLNTHARGQLEAIDRGKSSNHQATIRALWRGQQRFFTAADDKSIKAWPYSGGQPVTVKDGLPKMTAMTAVSYQGKPHLLVAGRDQSLRLVGLDTADKCTEVVLRIEDGYAWATHEFQQTEPGRREKAADFLADYDDDRALTLLAQRLSTENDKQLREHLVQALAKSKHEKATVYLQECLADKKHEAVRVIAYHSLLKRATEDDLRPLEKALATKHSDIGTLALQTLGTRAKKEVRALHLLQQALHNNTFELRHLALSLLEGVYPKKDPEAALQGLASKHPDIQRAALIRLYQRQLLTQAQVPTAILLQQDNNNALVRHTALLVAILSRPALAQALKQREKNLARQLQELEDFELQPSKTPTAKTAPSDKKTTALKEQDYQPLLQGIANPNADVCLAACFALAVLEDHRAFGLLLILGQEKKDTIRAEVCRALAYLKDPRGIEQLETLCNDKESKVRDAAFSALTVLQKEPLTLAQCGLQARHVDLHRRGLKVLLDTFSATSKAKTQQAATQPLLIAALNDEFPEIRQETFKACLNRQLGGDLHATLQLLLHSRFADVHEEVLSELMANIGQTWAADFLLTFFNDNYSSVRNDAFAFALKQKKILPILTVLTAAVQSEYLNIRKMAVEALLKKPSAQHQALLSKIINDNNRPLRQSALTALIELHNETLLDEALTSQFDDIRLAAGQACAQLGINKAYAVLQALASRPQPENKEDKKNWETLVIGALQGFARLGDSQAFEIVRQHLSSTHKKIINAAAKALPWVVNTTHIAALQALTGNELAIIKYHAALALSYLGDASAQSLLCSEAAQRQLSEVDQLAAMICLDRLQPTTIQSYSQSSSTYICSFLALFAKEHTADQKMPGLLMQTLSAGALHMQVTAADLLLHFGDAKAYWQYVQNWFNRQTGGYDKPWNGTLNDIRSIAINLNAANAPLQARLVQLLSQIKDYKQSQWKAHLRAFQKRYPMQSDTTRPKKILATTQNELYQTAFGAYLGIIRSKRTEDGMSLARLLYLRSYAITALAGLATRNPKLQESVIYSILPLLHHQQQALRQTAFDELKSLDTITETLGQAAIASPKEDIAAQGLDLLVSHYSPQKSKKLLQELTLNAEYSLAFSAFTLLAKATNEVNAAALALTAKSEKIRHIAVHKLAEHYAQADAQAGLQQASQHPDRNTALAACNILAEHQNEHALPILQTLLHSSIEGKEQRRIVAILQKLRLPQVPEYLLRYGTQSKQIKMPMEQLFEAIAQYREKALLAELLPLLAQDALLKPVFHTVVTLSGYDQQIINPDDHLADQTWLAKQHPRDDAILLTLFQRLLQLDQPNWAVKLMPSLRWAKATEINAALTAAFAGAQAPLFRALVEASSWRLLHRQGNNTGLLQALQHKDGEIQFLAAEALAQNGNPQGLTILLAAVEYLDRIDYRQRAVLALGALADLRALDKLLVLAENKEHALQEVAIEAIGHLSSGDKAEAIFKLLRDNLHRAEPYSDMITHALSGLRWCNHLAAWQLIENFAADPQQYYLARCHAIDLLIHREAAQQKDSATRALLLQLIIHDSDDDVVASALATAKTLWQTPPEQASDVDFALLQSHYPELEEEALLRVCQFAETERLLAALAVVQAEIVPALENALLQRQQYPPKALNQALASHDQNTVRIGAHITSRQTTLSTEVNKALEKAGLYWFDQWQQQLAKAQQNEENASTAQQLLTPLVLQLIWSCSYHGNDSKLFKALFASTTQADSLPLQVHALRALLTQTTPKISAEKQACLQSCISAPFTTLRTLATQLLARQKNQPAELSWLTLLHDPQSHSQPAFRAQMQQAATDHATQALALPYLLAHNDLATLSQLALQHDQEEGLRVGALEALGRLADAAAEQVLQQVQTQADEMLSKVAYKALRRSQRARTKQTAAGALP